jgi:UPF0716 protein FxsA
MGKFAAGRVGRLQPHLDHGPPAGLLLGDQPGRLGVLLGHPLSLHLGLLAGHATRIGSGAREPPRVALRAVFLLVLLFILVPIVEIYVIIQVGGAIGAGPTIALLILDGFLGAFLLRQQGRAAWIRFNRALAENRLPHKEVLDGVLIIFGGALLLTPGFITDVVGLVLLIPPTRAGVRALMARIVMGRLSMGPRAATWGYGHPRRRQRRRRAPGGPAANGPGEPPPRGRPAPDPGWDEALFPGRSRRSGPRPDDIEGSGHEVRDEDELPPPDPKKPFEG